MVCSESNEYSSLAGFIYIYNLLGGIGLLPVPKALSEAGAPVSIIILTLLAFVSFITSTFLLESMSISNGVLRRRALQDEDDVDGSTLTKGKEKSRLLVMGSSLNDEDVFELTTKVELGEMAEMFFNKAGVRLFYLCIVLYLYGDLAIYATSIPKSLKRVVCGFEDEHVNKTMHSTQCWGMSTTSVYRIFVVIFAVLVFPFTFMKIQKTKYLQYLTTFLRWFSFGTMVVVSFIHIAKHKTNHIHHPVFQARGIPFLFGATVYSFMFHHSIPSVVMPVRDKENLTKILAFAIVAAHFCYIVLSLTAIFTFHGSDIKDVYSLSFRGITVDAISTFLALYPVFTLSTTYPVLSITLRENLKALFRQDGEQYHWILDKLAFPLLAGGPPIVIALYTQDVSLLVNVTGSYAGVGLQYVIPAMLVYCGRRMASDMFGEYQNEYKSSFVHSWWIWAIIGWSVVCVAVVTVYNVMSIM